MMNTDGTNLRNLTNSPKMETEPDWSPDGLEIVFTSHRADGRGIYVMNADGTDARLLSTDPDSDRYGSWSPDGERLAFRSYRCCGGWPGLFVQDLESGKVRRLDTPFNMPQYLTWTPDGSGILFNENQPNSQLYIFDLETEETRTLIDWQMPGYSGHPSWFESRYYAVMADRKLSVTWGSFKAQVR